MWNSTFIPPILLYEVNRNNFTFQTFCHPMPHSLLVTDGVEKQTTNFYIFILGDLLTFAFLFFELLFFRLFYLLCLHPLVLHPKSHCGQLKRTATMSRGIQNRLSSVFTKLDEFFPLSCKSDLNLPADVTAPAVTPRYGRRACCLWH